MLRNNLEDIPVFALPAGFSLRWYRRGDEANWLRIDTLANPESPCAPDFFGRCFGADHDLLAQRQCYLLNGSGEAIGTASAWFDDNFQGARIGRIHYVAVIPEFQGRGLSKPLMTVVCQRLRELGHDRAYLATSTARIPAINLYLAFGFVPLSRTEEEAAAWREICPQHAAEGFSLPACGPGQPL